MKRLLLTAAVLLVALIAARTGPSATGQDRTEERLSALETRVAVLEREAGISESEPRRDEPGEMSAAITLTGSSDGEQSRRVTLQSGQYEVEVSGTVSSQFGGLLQVTIEGPGQFDYALPFNEIIDSSGPYSATAELYIADSGDVTISVNTLGFSNWTMTMSKVD